MATPDTLQDLVLAFQDALGGSGLHGGLRFLNQRTPHRFTGVYLYDGETLRNVCLFDRFNPAPGQGDDAPIGNTFCSLLPQFDGSLAFAEACKDVRASHIETPVVSYCGVQLRDQDGAPIGTLCHFDLKPCQPRISDRPFLDRVAPLLQRELQSLSTAPTEA